MARLVIYGGTQWDADNLPPHVPADECVPADEWFAAGRATRSEQPEQQPEQPEQRRGKRR